MPKRSANETTPAKTRQAGLGSHKSGAKIDVGKTSKLARNNGEPSNVNKCVKQAEVSSQTTKSGRNVVLPCKLVNEEDSSTETPSKKRLKKGGKCKTMTTANFEENGDIVLLEVKGQSTDFINEKEVGEIEYEMDEDNQTKMDSETEDEYREGSNNNATRVHEEV